MNAALMLLLWRMGSGTTPTGIEGPYRIAAQQTYVAGTIAADSHIAGFAKAQTYVAGAKQGDYQ